MQKYSLYMQLNKTNDAIKQIEALTQKFPKDIEALEILSELYLLNNQKNKALKVFHEIAKIEPGNGHVHLKLANYYRDQGENEKSYEELKKAFQVEDKFALRKKADSNIIATIANKILADNNYEDAEKK